MQVSQKCQYALRAIFQLAVQEGTGPVKIAQVAKKQAIPVKFLEVILGQLKQGQFVKSTRGAEGGYELNRNSGELTVGEVMRFIEGSLGPVDCLLGNFEDNKCPFNGDCVFLPMWEKVQDAVSNVYDMTTFKDLVNDHIKRSEKNIQSYSI
jgi:Rrf2 family transcriptional regulator, cysteine metabolism repressor